MAVSTVGVWFLVKTCLQTHWLRFKCLWSLARHVNLQSGLRVLRIILGRRHKQINLFRFRMSNGDQPACSTPLFSERIATDTHHKECKTIRLCRQLLWGNRHCFVCLITATLCFLSPIESLLESNGVKSLWFLTPLIFVSFFLGTF